MLSRSTLFNACRSVSIVPNQVKLNFIHSAAYAVGIICYDSNEEYCVNCFKETFLMHHQKGSLISAKRGKSF